MKRKRSVAIGTIGVAIWDAVAKATGRPLWHVLRKRYGDGTGSATVPIYVGGGWYQPENDLQALQEEVRHHLGAGYTALKIKTGGVPLDDDCHRLDAVLAILGRPDALAVDANAALSLAQGIACVDRLALYGLRWSRSPARRKPSPISPP